MYFAGILEQAFETYSVEVNYASVLVDIYGWWTKSTKTTVNFAFCVRFPKMFSPRRAGKGLPEMVQNPKCVDLIDCTSHICFEGPRDRAIGFTDPRPENRVQVLLDYVHHQYILLQPRGAAVGRGAPVMSTTL